MINRVCIALKRTALQFLKRKTMQSYKGKAKCSCGKKAKWKAGFASHPTFACNDCKSKLIHLFDYEEDEKDLTEADYQTWARCLDKTS